MDSESSALLDASVSPSRIINRLGYGRFQLFLFIGLSLCSLSFSFGATLSGFILFIVDKNWELSTLEVALFGSMMIVAMGCGYSLCILLEPKYGRWKLIMGGQIASIFFSLTSTFVPEFYTLLLTRFIVMTAVTMTSSPCYSSFPEMVPSKYRGVFQSAADLLGAVGTIIIWAYLYCFIPDLEGEGWRLMQLLLCLFFTLPLVALCYWLIEESPVYLWQTNQASKAIQALNRMANFNNSPLLTPEETSALLVPVTVSISTLVSLKELCTGKYTTISWVLLLLWCTHTLGYFGMMSVYPYLIGGENVDSSDTLTSILIYSLAVIPMVIVLVLIVDHPNVGRRGTFIILTLISIVCLGTPVVVMDDAVVITCIACFLANEYAIIALLLLYTSEIYETSLRASALAYCNLSSRVVVTMAVYGVVVLAEFSLRLTFIVLGGLFIVAFLMLVWVKCETRGILLDGDTITDATRAVN